MVRFLAMQFFFPSPSSGLQSLNEKLEAATSDCCTIRCVCDRIFLAWITGQGDFVGSGVNPLGSAAADVRAPGVVSGSHAFGTRV